MDETKKSINSILYERTVSPFYGTFIVSWLIWNWKIIYLTLFISENIIKMDKLSYMTKYSLLDVKKLLVYPAISTIILLTIFPFISNGAYWLNLKFKKWKRDKKNEIELKQLLTLEQSIELREQISTQEERFEKLLSDKNLRIKQLEQMTPVTKTDKNSLRDSERENLELLELSEKIKADKSSKSTYNNLVRYIQGGWIIDMQETPAPFLALLESHDIIKPKGAGVYQWGNNGKEFHKLISK